MADWFKLNGELVEVTEAHMKVRWCGYSDGRKFRCAKCGHRFKVGDKFRSVYTNYLSGAGGNPFVCEQCNDTDVAIAEWVKNTRQEVKEQYWWFIPDMEAHHEQG